MMNHTVLRALPACTARACLRPAPRIAPAVLLQQSRAAHAISNPTLANIEKRYESMPPQEQAEMWMALRERMKVDWKEMTLQEKKAAYWLAFGPHGARAGTPPGEGRRVAMLTLAGCAAAVGIFSLTRMFARDPPKTMTREYQEASNEYLKGQNVEPITGISSPDYKGSFMVQSPPAKKEK